MSFLLEVWVFTPLSLWERAGVSADEK